MYARTLFPSAESISDPTRHSKTWFRTGTKRQNQESPTFAYLLDPWLPSLEEAGEKNAAFTYGLTKLRPEQRVFRASVLSHHGAKCAFCSIAQDELLEAAHVYPFARGGDNGYENGIPLCRNHHAAFDAFLIAVEPITLKLVPRSDSLAIGVTATTLSGTYKDIAEENWRKRWDLSM